MRWSGEVCNDLSDAVLRKYSMLHYPNTGRWFFKMVLRNVWILFEILARNSFRDCFQSVFAVLHRQEFYDFKNYATNEVKYECLKFPSHKDAGWFATRLITENSLKMGRGEKRWDKNCNSPLWIFLNFLLCKMLNEVQKCYQQLRSRVGRTPDDFEMHLTSIDWICQTRFK